MDRLVADLHAAPPRPSWRRRARRWLWRRRRSHGLPAAAGAALWTAGQVVAGLSGPGALLVPAVVVTAGWIAVLVAYTRCGAAHLTHTMWSVAGAAGWVAATALDARTGGGGSAGLVVVWAGGVLVLGGAYAARYRAGPARPEVVAVRVRPPIVQVWDDLVGRDSGGCLPGSHLLNITAVPNGTAATVQLVGGRQHTGTATGQHALIKSAYASGLGVGDDQVEVEPTPCGRRDQARLLLLDRNPLHEVQAWAGPSLSLASQGAAACARYGDSSVAQMRWFDLGSGALNWIVAGVPGSGKTSFVNWLLAESVHATYRHPDGTDRPLIGTVFADGKNGQSIPEATTSPGIAWCGTWPQENARAILGVQNAMYARQRHVGRLVWTDPAGRARRGMAWFDPITAALPYLQLVIEEWSALVRAYPWLVPIVHNIAKLGRSLGIRVVLISQSITGDELGGPELRSMIGGGAVVFRTRDRHTGGLAFPGGMDVDPSTLPADLLGACYVQGVAPRSAMARGLLVRDPYGWLSTAAPWQLGAVDVAAMGDDLVLASSRREFWERHGVDPSEDPELWARHRGLPETAPEPGPVVPAPGGPPSGSAVTPLRALVLAAVPDGQDVTPAGVRTHVAAHSDRTWSDKSIRNSLSTLVEAGVLVKPGHGRYRRP